MNKHKGQEHKQGKKVKILYDEFSLKNSNIFVICIVTVPVNFRK